GKVISYDRREDMQALAHRNLKRVELEDQVEFRLHDIAEGFDETEVDALFLDLPSPQIYLPQARVALCNGGTFGSILPTANQVSDLLYALQHNSFALMEVCEIFLRFYKPVPERLRPTDRMVAHTGYLVFARAIVPEPQPETDASNTDFTQAKPEQ
ncbi:MAG: tRNA (adenine-N1)-methyltransferase, partial [Anaerolineales bacterium]